MTVKFIQINQEQAVRVSSVSRVAQCTVVFHTVDGLVDE